MEVGLGRWLVVGLALGEVLGGLCLVFRVIFRLMCGWGVHFVDGVLDTFLYLGGPGKFGCDCGVSSGGEKVLLLQDEPGESGCDCKEPSGRSGGSVLANDIISFLSSGLASGVASAPSRIHRASRHGASLRNSLAVRCCFWGEQLVLWLVLALKSFGIIV